MIERLVGHLKEMRRLATRYDKLQIIYHNMIYLAFIVFYLRALSKCCFSDKA